MADSFLVLNHNIDGTDEAHLVTRLAQNQANNIRGSGFAIGAGNTNHAQALAGVIIKIGSHYFHRCSSIGHDQQGYSIGNNLRQLLNQRCHSTLGCCHS